MTVEEFYKLGVGERIVPADINDQADGYYLVIGKTNNDQFIAVKTALISRANIKFWNVVMDVKEEEL